jgi:GT2 family glycosyltransferase
VQVAAARSRLDPRDPPANVSAAVALEIDQEGEVQVASQVLSPSPVLQWHTLRLRCDRGGPLAICLRADRHAPGAPANALVYWADPRVESPRTWRHIAELARAMLTLRNGAALVDRLRSPDETERYRRWLRSQRRSAGDHRRERRWSKPQHRRFTVITHASDPERGVAEATVTALLRQSYPHWEWLIAAPADAKRLAALGAGRDARIRVLTVADKASTAAVVNAALAEAGGDYVGLLGPADSLEPECFYEVARAVEAHPGIDLVYSDEDVESDAGARSRPVLKPAWSPDLLLASPYVGRLAMFAKARLHQLGGMREGIAGSEEWDLCLRLSRDTTGVRRIPRCLYHRRDAAMPVDTAAVRVLSDRCEGFGANLVVSRVGDAWRSRWTPARTPLVSIIVPNRNAAAIMRQCARGLLENTDYPHRELIIVDNGSTDPETLALYARLTQTASARIVPFDRPFNFSAACNLGAAAASGELLLFLNNDIEVIEPEWLDELVRWGLRPEVGVVGAQLLYPDRTIQHAGVIVGLGLVGHIYSRADVNVRTVFGSPATYRNYLAVTGACQLMRREVFDRLGGFDERFRISFSDVELCLRAWTGGYRVVYTPYARLIHHESYTRERDDAPQDKKLLAAYLRTNGFEDDPYFHPELNPRSVIPMLRPAFEAEPAAAVRALVDRTLAADMGAR